MQPHAAQPADWIQYAITAGVIAVVVAIRWRRMSRVVPLRLERLWIFPAFYAVVAIALFATRPPVGLAWLFCAVALLIGAALGWQRGKLMRITVDPDTHALNQTGSPAAMLFILAIIAVRSGARYALAGDNFLHLNALAVTDMLVALALGLFTTQRIEMFLRARRMLDEAREQSKLGLAAK
jgi:hypothetical protein